MLRLFVSTPLGMAELLRGELAGLGAQDARTRAAGVQCRASLQDAYRICLWSRLASRVLVELARFEARDSESLYRGVRGVHWPEVFDLQATFAVRATLLEAAIGHSGFAAQRVKDAVVDDFRATFGSRPSVDKTDPDVRLHLHVQGKRAVLSLDLAGESLHRRGYRAAGGAAPLKENLAAAIVQLAGWPAIAERGGTLLDPLCGTGTLLIEGAMAAANMAPGLGRARFGLHGWARHDETCWRLLVDAARAEVRPPPPMFGYDIDARSLRIARESAEKAGFGAAIVFAKGALEALQPPHAGPGLLLTNPPYGERLGAQDLPGLYQQFGLVLRRFGGWHAALFSGNADLVHRTRCRARARHALYNGALPCVLFDFGLQGGRRAPAAAPVRAAANVEDDALVNRLRKNLRQLRRWREREGVSCYRLYDADIPEYAFAIDYYAGERANLHIQEYAPPANIDPDRARQRGEHVARVVADLFATETPRLHHKARSRQRGAVQYRRQDRQRDFDVVEEQGLRFYVNFTDYLDTGLFLDHRRVRARVRDAARDRAFLNLFAYTGAATVYAAAGGAASTTSVDLSNTYLDWAADNLRLNGLAGAQHEFVRAECLAWLRDAARAPRRWDLILLDPPSFSNSKASEHTLDVQRDHALLLRAAARVLAPGGTLLFSTNRRRFRLDSGLDGELGLVEISRQTGSPDFARRTGHRCWELRAAA